MNSHPRMWKKVESRQLAIEFWCAGTEALRQRVAGGCPSCRANRLRYYAHHFGADRSAFWVWCSSCGEWAVASNMRLDISFTDPFADVRHTEFEQMERSNWLDRLDSLWESGMLPGMSLEESQERSQEPT